MRPDEGEQGISDVFICALGLQLSRTFVKRGAYGCQMCPYVPRPAAPVEWVFEMEDREEVQSL